MKDAFVEAVAKEFRNLSNEERAHWEDKAREEKARYAKEKETYKGPHYARKLRAKKNPLAPKRPMSAFLMFAQNKRKHLQADNPDMSNADISRLLGELWRNASREDKSPYLEREEMERKYYRAKMESWKCDQKLVQSLKSPNEKKGILSKKSEQREDIVSYLQAESTFNQRHGE